MVLIFSPLARADDAAAKSDSRQKIIDGLKKDAEHGNVNAEYMLGIMFLSSKNYQEAFLWAKKAADAGDAEAQALLAGFYEGSEVVSKNINEEIRLLLKSAKQGYEPAQRKLAQLYSKGSNLPQNYEESYFWELLADDGKKNSEQERIAEHLTASQISDVEKRAESWTPVSDNAEGNAACTNPVKLLMTFDDSERTSFLIPSAYLYDPYHVYNKGRGSLELISVLARKDNFGPACPAKIWRRSRVIEIRLMKGKVCESRRPNKNYIIQDKISENDNFEVYNIRGGDDIVIPKDTTLANKLLIECSHTHDHGWGDCHLYALVSDTVCAKYDLDQKKFSDYRNINQKVVDLVRGFIVK